MNISLKSFLIAFPLAVLLQGLIMIFGFSVFGENLNFTVINIIGVGFGLLCFFSVKGYLAKNREQN